MPPPSGNGARASGSRAKARAFELRAQVTEDSYSFLVKQAVELGRPRAWHVGLIVEAIAVISQHLTSPELAQLDVLLRQPDQLLAAVRRSLKSPP